MNGQERTLKPHYLALRDFWTGLAHQQYEDEGKRDGIDFPRDIYTRQFISAKLYELGEWLDARRTIREVEGVVE